MLSCSKLKLESTFVIITQNTLITFMLSNSLRINFI